MGRVYSSLVTMGGVGAGVGDGVGWGRGAGGFTVMEGSGV